MNARCPDQVRVRARRWEHGWELDVEGIGVTQSRTLAAADQVVRDYLATLYDVDAAGVGVRLQTDLGGLEHKVSSARADMAAAQAQVCEAAEHMRKVVWHLRHEGYSVRDVATILGVSPGRVSQLTH